MAAALRTHDQVPRSATTTAVPATLVVNLASLARSGVLLAVAASGLVFSEPAPFDLVMLGLIVLLPLAGQLRLAPGMMMNFVLWLGCGAGALVAASMSQEIAISARHTGISFYLYAMMLVLAAFIALKPAEHGRLVLRAWVFAGIVAALAGMCGYFRLVPGAFELFTKFGRAAGTFKDPNVLGPFLVPPVLFLVHRVLHGEARRPLLDLAGIATLVAAILLTFSRGAWLNLVAAVALYGALTYLTLGTIAGRVRLVAYAVLGMALAVAGLLAVLQIPEVASLLAERSALVHSYDVGPEGRFGGQAKAIALILANPLGIGAGQFSAHYHNEDVHNVYLSMFLNAGWLGGLLYVAAVAVTLWAGFGHALKGTPTRPLFLIALTALVGTVIEGFVVDTDHWRHFYVLLAIMWGLIGAEHARSSHARPGQRS